MVHTSNTAPVQRISHRKLGHELREAIDVLIDPLSPGRRPVEYTRAYRDLLLLVDDEDRWAMIFEIQPGCATNYILNVLKPFRVEFLKAWRATELKR